MKEPYQIVVYLEKTRIIYRSFDLEKAVKYLEETRQNNQKNGYYIEVHSDLYRDSGRWDLAS
jgi:hypothetical protein